MTITLVDRRHVPEAARRPGRLAFKNAEPDVATGQTLAVDEHEGIVTAIVSVTGVEDEVADIIEPGAYRDTLTKRRPKVCWAHKWEAPIGRVLHIEELHPGDERLPVQQRDGSPWPREAGALVATMQFNLKSAAGRDAFEAVVFYSETGECEYSIGYQVPTGKATKDKNGVRRIKALDLYELSVVLFGAHTMTGTLSIKDAAAGARRRQMTAAARLAEAKALLDADNETEEEAPDHSDGVMVALYPDPAAADAVAAQVSGPDATLDRADLHVTLAFLGTTEEVTLDPEQIVRKVTEAVEGLPVLSGEIAGIGMFPDNGDGAPTWAPVDVPGLGLLRETVVDALGEEVRTDHGFTPHMTLGYGIGLIDPVTPVPVTFSAVRVVYGTQQYDITLDRPVEGEAKTARPPRREVKDAAHLDETATGITSVCDACGDEVEFDTMDGWQRLDGSVTHEDGTTHTDHMLPPDGYVQVNVTDAARLTGSVHADDTSLDGDPESMEGKAQGGADRNRGGAEKLRRYWVRGEGAAKIGWGTPGDWQRCVNLLRKHMGERAKGYCNLRHKDALGFYPAEHAKRVRAGKAHSYDPALDTPPVDVEVKSAPSSFPHLPGSYEERIALVRRTVTEAMRGEEGEDGKPEWDYVEVQATWEDRVIATRTQWAAGSEDRRESYELPYRITGEGVELGDPEPVELQVVASTADGHSTEEFSLADAVDLSEHIDRVVYTIKSSRPATIEGKAGRVLSGRNERALRDAVERLIDVLAAAGVDVHTEDGPRPQQRGDARERGDQRREMDPRVDLESTSPSANPSGTKVLTRDQIDADLAALLDL